MRIGDWGLFISTRHSTSGTEGSVFRRQFGYTLVELVMSMAVMTVVMGGIGSAIFLAARGVDARSPLAGLVEGGRVVDQMAGELACALGFTELSATAVKFSVPDRDGDGTPETILYAWSDTPGDPLTRQYNGGMIANVVEDVQAFALTYELGEITREGEPTKNESAETLLISQDTSAALKDFALTDKQWIGQYFFPPLPADATAWEVTRVKFMARIHGGDSGITAVQLRLPTLSQLPSTTVLEQVPMYESGLGESYSWEEFSFGSVSELSPNEGLCLVLALQQKDNHLADVLYDDARGAARLTTSDGGSNWDYDHEKSMLYYVYGTVTTPGEAEVVIDKHLQAVNIGLRVGPDASSGLETAVQVLNTPEVSGL